MDRNGSSIFGRRTGRVTAWILLALGCAAIFAASAQAARAHRGAQRSAHHRVHRGAHHSGGRGVHHSGRRGVHHSGGRGVHHHVHPSAPATAPAITLASAPGNAPTIAPANAPTTAPANAHRDTGWPFTSLQMGVESNIGTQVTPQEASLAALRYAYLAGGANTGQGWAQFSGAVSSYISESEANQMIPVFTYNQLQQSYPGRANPSECGAELENLSHAGTMRSYFEDLKNFFLQAATATGTVIMHYEPDLWGCIQQAAVGGDLQIVPIPAANAAAVPAEVAGSGMPELAGLPDTASGLAQAVLRLRDRYAPRVLVGYHDSYWGTGIDLQLNHPTDAQVLAMAASSVAFYRTLHARFDLLFSETSDRDAGYWQTVAGQGSRYWWTGQDFLHLSHYLAAIHAALGLPTVIWQIPTGTTDLNDTPYHYADNKLQSLLGTDPGARSLLASFASAGVCAMLFGPSLPTDTQLTGAVYSRFSDYFGIGALPVG